MPAATDDIEVLRRISKKLFGSFAWVSGPYLLFKDGFVVTFLGPIQVLRMHCKKQLSKIFQML